MVGTFCEKSFGPTTYHLRKRGYYSAFLTFFTKRLMMYLTVVYLHYDSLFDN